MSQESPDSRLPEKSSSPTTPSTPSSPGSTRDNPLRQSAARSAGEKAQSETLPKALPKKKPAHAGLAFLTLGWEMAAWLGLAAYAGQWLNPRWGPEPLGLLLCLLVGFIGCGWSVYRAIRRLGN